jgi:hypothetical protein
MSHQTTSSARIHETLPTPTVATAEDFLSQLHSAPLAICSADATDAWHAYLDGNFTGCANALTTLGGLLTQPEASSAATLIRRTSPGVFQELALSVR